MTTTKGGAQRKGTEKNKPQPKAKKAEFDKKAPIGTQGRTPKLATARILKKPLTLGKPDGEVKGNPSAADAAKKKGKKDGNRRKRNQGRS